MRRSLVAVLALICGGLAWGPGGSYSRDNSGGRRSDGAPRGRQRLESGSADRESQLVGLCRHLEPGVQLRPQRVPATSHCLPGSAQSVDVELEGSRPLRLQKRDR